MARRCSVLYGSEPPWSRNDALYASDQVATVWSQFHAMHVSIDATKLIPFL
jgi:hypothetical protein